MPSNALFDPMFTTPAMADAVGAEAWLRAMLRFEAVLARAEAAVGVIPAEAGERVAAFCATVRLDPAEIGHGAVSVANPAGPFVEALTRAAPRDVAPYLHRGATSQDVLDTAMMLVAREAAAVLGSSLDRLATASAGLAERHRTTLLLGRTLLQPAVPITFGLKAAGWLAAVLEAKAVLLHWQQTAIALQFGGAAGTLASLGQSGTTVATLLGEALELPVPPLPWHTARGRLLRLAAALAECTGVAGKIALDILLLAQGEIAEVAEGGDAARGRSSAMPHKRNPSRSVLVEATVHRAQGLLPVFSAGMAHEHERAAGAWQAEWATISDLFALADAAVAGAADLLKNLQVDKTRMRRNLDAQGGLPMAESMTTLLARTIDSREARGAVERAIARSSASGRSFADELTSDPAITRHLGPGEIANALDPAHYLGASSEFIDRALAAWRNRQH